MEKITMETLISTLFAVGFNEVDNMIYTYVKEALYEMGLCEFDDSEPSEEFNKLVEDKGFYFKLRDEFFIYQLPINNELLIKLEELDYRKIIFKKMIMLGSVNIDYFDSLFCDKEKLIIDEMFGISRMNRENAIKLRETYDYLSDEGKSIQETIKFFNKKYNKNKDK